jgi:predicted ATP-grasp superfamily ATP-dependent carboligase
MRALVIGSNTTLALNVVSALGAAGAEADVMTDWYAPRLRFSRYCRNYTRVPASSFDFAAPGGAAARFLENYCRTHRIDVVIPADLRTAMGLAHLRDGVLPCFPVASPHVLGTLHDKWAFHQLVSGEQLPSPKTVLLNVAAPEELQLPYPIIVKPAAGEGGEGIHVCETPEALAQLCASAALSGGRYIAQQFIAGQDVDISVLADHGRIVAHTIQHTETEDTKRFVQDPRMLEVAAGIVKATGFHGLAHFDMRVAAEDGSLYVLECNPRVWGSLMYSVWAGVNFIELGCQIARGLHVAAGTAPTETVWHQGVAPRRLLKALLQGRSAPQGMTGATLSSWQQAHRDPFIQLVGSVTEKSEAFLRERFSQQRLAFKSRPLPAL